MWMQCGIHRDSPLYQTFISFAGDLAAKMCDGVFEEEMDTMSVEDKEWRQLKQARARVRNLLS